MNMSEKVGRLGGRLQRVDVSSHRRENLLETNVLPDTFFLYQKRDMTSSVTWSQRFECFSSFLKYIFRHKLARFCCYSLQIFAPYYPWVIVIPFSKQKKTKTEQIKIEKETYSWDFCKIAFQLNCLFAEINVQRLLTKENFKN